MVHGSRLSGCGRAHGILYSDVGAGASNVGAGSMQYTLHKTSTAVSMKELRAILSAGSELRLRSDTETHLRAALSTVKKLFRDAERVLSDTNEILHGGMQDTNGVGPAKWPLAPALDAPVQSQSRIVPGPGKSSCLLISQSQSPAKKVGSCSGATTVVAPGHADDDEDEEDEEFGSRGRKGSAEARSGDKSKTPLHVLSDLLSALDRVPPGALAARDMQYSFTSSPATALRELYEASVELKDRVDAVLDRAAVARVLKPK